MTYTVFRVKWEKKKVGSPKMKVFLKMLMKTKGKKSDPGNV